MTVTPPQEQPSPVLVAIGWLLTVLGGLWTVLTGVCTGVFLVMTIGEAARGGGAASMMGILMFGAVSIAPGAGMLWGGILILRHQRRLRRRPPTDAF